MNDTPIKSPPIFRKLPTGSECYVGENISNNSSNPELKLAINIGKQLLIELEKITSHIEANQNEENKRDEWKFVSMVMDQFCFYLFSFSCLCSLIFTLGQAPGLQVTRKD